MEAGGGLMRGGVVEGAGREEEEEEEDCPMPGLVAAAAQAGSSSPVCRKCAGEAPAETARFVDHRRTIRKFLYIEGKVQLYSTLATGTRKRLTDTSGDLEPGRSCATLRCGQPESRFRRRENEPLSLH